MVNVIDYMPGDTLLHRLNPVVKLGLAAAIIVGIFADVPLSRTHYGNGCAPIYYGAGYVSQSEWWKNGFVMTTITTVIYLTIGAAWWKVIGLW